MSGSWKTNRNRRQEKRYSARYLLLRYVRTPAKFDPDEIRRLVALQKAISTIVCEQNVFSNSATYLVFIDFSGKRFQTRNDKLFDVQGNHPQWHPVTRSPTQVYNWCKNRGTVIFDDALQKGASHVDATASMFDDWKVHVSSSDQTDFFERCEDILPAPLQNPLRELEAELYQPTAKTIRARSTSKQSDIWSEGFKAGFEMAVKVNATVPDLGASCKQRLVEKEGTIDDSLSPFVSSKQQIYPSASSRSCDCTRSEQMQLDCGANFDFEELDVLSMEPPAFSMDDMLFPTSTALKTWPSTSKVPSVGG